MVAYDTNNGRCRLQEPRMRAAYSNGRGAGSTSTIHLPFQVKTLHNLDWLHKLDPTSRIKKGAFSSWVNRQKPLNKAKKTNTLTQNTKQWPKTPNKITQNSNNYFKSVILSDTFIPKHLKITYFPTVT
jgi:hypothetical protein